MPKIIVTAEVKDAAAWEKGFRTHGDLFKAQTCSQMEYSINGNQVAVLAAPQDFDAFMALFEAPETAEAMACREGLALASDLLLQKFRIATDCQNVVRSMQGSGMGPYDHLIQEIKSRMHDKLHSSGSCPRKQKNKWRCS